MAKDFEETVLKKLDALSTDVGELKQDVRRLELFHEEMKDKIETVIEIGEAQKELWQQAATKEDIHEVELYQGLTRSASKNHSVSIADHERRLKRIETKLKAEAA